MSERAKYMVEIARKQMRHAEVDENSGDILQNGNGSSKSVVSEVFQEDDSCGGNRADNQETDRRIEEESAVLHTENCSSKRVVSKVFREYDTFGGVENQETVHAVEGDDDMNIIYPTSTDELEVEDPYSSDDSLRDRNYVPDSSSSSDSEQSSESRKVMFELILGTSVVNSLIIYNLCAKEKLSITEFRRQLAYSLVKSPNSEETIKVPKKRVHSFQKPDGPGRKKRKPYMISETYVGYGTWWIKD
ncbi:unnamed protein product [Acanthoscelides obtectus]|uniref:Uncharacterized protein n=1 Tax=Acanthoscelides obtectus TaxID=200917 RepID=A0A9P0KPC8_ACAOB|nr:unnamed protein product [Acanthoscelides obtectus]CAK1655117.1 hypothetical protein AOBTE_LOCUS19035 [Acanthoscelides obtectus]